MYRYIYQSKNNVCNMLNPQEILFLFSAVKMLSYLKGHYKAANAFLLSHFQYMFPFFFFSFLFFLFAFLKMCVWMVLIKNAFCLPFGFKSSCHQVFWSKHHVITKSHHFSMMIIISMIDPKYPHFSFLLGPIIKV